MAPRLILASASPQRRAILEQIGVPFFVRVSGADELEEGPAAEVALENAYRKAAAVAGSDDDDVPPALPVLGVDTVVSLGARTFGKAANADEARQMLTALAGQRHIVVSGVWRFYRDDYYKGPHWVLGPGYYESFFAEKGPDDVVSSFQCIALT